MDFNASHIAAVYTLGSYVSLNWTTPWTNVSLVLWQNGIQNFQYLPNSLNMVNLNYYTWTCDISGKNGNPKFDLSYGDVFFFGIFESGTSNLFEGQFFIIKDITSSSSTSSTSSSLIPASTASPTSPGSPTVFNSTTSPPQPSKGSNKAIGIGVGVGVGVAVLLVLAFVGGLCLHRRQKRLNTEAALRENQPFMSPPQQPFIGSPDVYAQKVANPNNDNAERWAKVELPVPEPQQHPVYELPTPGSPQNSSRT